MSFFILPEIYINNIEQCFDLNMLDNSIVCISLSLNQYLNKVKKHIEDNFNSWDFIKRYTNPYEFIHTIVPNTKHSVSKLKPLSRSFYKLIEIVDMLHIFENFTSKDINTFHLAEGPGGFIEATSYLRNNKNDKYHGMTLIDKDPNIPGWKKSQRFLETNNNVIIEYGPTETGDILEVDNLIYCYEKYYNKMDIITADGGFDFSNDFNEQETLATKLLFAQVSFAISMQAINGHFILKIFDIFTKATVDIIYLLTTLYKQVYIVKPNTSRLANSEKYIVCKYFKGNHIKLINNIITIYPRLKQYSYISSVINFNLDYYFLNRLEEINAILGQQQIENINATINLIMCKNKQDKLEIIKQNCVLRCIQWCIQYNIPCNNLTTNSNIFIDQD